MVRSEGNMSLKNPVTPPGIDHETFRVVAQRLNHYATPSSSLNIKYAKYINPFVFPTKPLHKGADKSLARPGRKQATATDDFYFRISCL